MYLIIQLISPLIIVFFFLKITVQFSISITYPGYHNVSINNRKYILLTGYLLCAIHSPFQDTEPWLSIKYVKLTNTTAPTLSSTRIVFFQLGIRLLRLILLSGLLHVHSTVYSIPHDSISACWLETVLYN